MAAFVVAPAAPSRVRRTGAQLNIFPGSATPTVFAAHTPFWIGYGFVPAPQQKSGGTPLDRTTRFELTVDGARVPGRTDVEEEGGHIVSKLTVASFDAGLPAGWHRFSGRWYVGGKLLLSNETSIEFVEP